MSFRYEEEIIDLTGPTPFAVTRTTFFSPDSIIDLANDSIICIDEPSYTVERNHDSDVELSSPTQEVKSSETTNQSNKENAAEEPPFNFGNCPICWEKLGTNALASTKCGHVYCLECLKTSLSAEKSCPTCRRVLKGPTAYHPLYVGPS